MKNKKFIKYMILILSFVFLFNTMAFADSTTVVTLGKKFKQRSKKTNIRYF